PGYLAGVGMNRSLSLLVKSCFTVLAERVTGDASLALTSFFKTNPGHVSVSIFPASDVRFVYAHACYCGGWPQASQSICHWLGSTRHQSERHYESISGRVGRRDRQDDQPGLFACGQRASALCE